VLPSRWDVPLRDPGIEAAQRSQVVDTLLAAYEHVRAQRLLADFGRPVQGNASRSASARTTYCCRWDTHREGQQCAKLQSSDPRTWVTAVQGESSRSRLGGVGAPSQKN